MSTQRYSRLQEEIRLLALPLGISETVNETCPVCGKDKFYLTRTEVGVLYCCHRASCGVRGFVGSNASDVHKVGVRKARNKSKPFDKEMTQLSKMQAVTLTKMFSLDPQWLMLHWRWCESMQRVIMPIHNIRHGVIGHNARHWDVLTEQPLSGPKSITYWNDQDTCKADFYIANTDCPKIRLVEDQPSAVRLHLSGYNVVALIGTNIHNDVVTTLKDHGYQDITMILDADATAKALEARKKWALFFHSFNVLPLEGPDIKDMEDDEYSRLLRRL